MKKNKMMRIASVLLVAVILTTCAISGTFAKYVTSGNGSDSARVAKFGVTVTGTADTFKETYAKNDAGFTLAANTVVSTEDVVAPGTSGSMAAFTITGTPEVAVRVAFTGTLELGDKWVSDASSTYYCPIEITVGSDTFKGTTYASADEFEAAVNAKIATFTKDYEANTDLSTIGGDAPAISWKWAFEGNDNVKDTYLGDQAAAGNAATISLDVTATVTQID
ncbi:MAG: hypothetical protein U0L17_02320 [Acutalibacteraceae bacterium]|nr:hypothetical protein [Acutalibacteraceae bacterium]